MIYDTTFHITLDCYPHNNSAVAQISTHNPEHTRLGVMTQLPTKYFSPEKRLTAASLSLDTLLLTVLSIDTILSFDIDATDDTVNDNIDDVFDVVVSCTHA